VPDGVCGAVAASGQTEVVPDVRARPGHIACDIHTRSEVVAPIVREGRVIGVLDVDSNTPDAFGPEQVRIVEAAAAAIAAVG
jgi:L-methionine (R)-S-oxide reductase